MINPESDRPSLEDTSAAEAAHAARDGDEIRADMDRTLDALERKFSPRQLLDQSAAFLRENGASLVSGIGTTVRRYPAPTFLTCAGLLWLVTSLVRGSRASGERLVESSEHAAGTDSGSNPLHRTAQAAHGKMQSAMRAVKDRSSEVSENFSGTVQDHPLMIGALALALGAVLGAVIPLTETENRTLRPVRDKALAKAEEVASRTYENVQEALTPKTKGPEPSPG